MIKAMGELWAAVDIDGGGDKPDCGAGGRRTSKGQLLKRGLHLSSGREEMLD
jgi:hypothetical protein